MPSRSRGIGPQHGQVRTLAGKSVLTDSSSHPCPRMGGSRATNLGHPAHPRSKDTGNHNLPEKRRLPRPEPVVARFGDNLRAAGSAGLGLATSPGRRSDTRTQEERVAWLLSPSNPPDQRRCRDPQRLAEQEQGLQRRRLQVPFEQADVGARRPNLERDLLLVQSG